VARKRFRERRENQDEKACQFRQSSEWSEQGQNSDVMLHARQDLPRLRRNGAIKRQALDAIHETAFGSASSTPEDLPNRPSPVRRCELVKVPDISVLLLQSRFRDGNSELLAPVIANDHFFALQSPVDRTVLS
jgi:hypothetical protein